MQSGNTTACVLLVAKEFNQGPKAGPCLMPDNEWWPPSLTGQHQLPPHPLLVTLLPGVNKSFPGPSVDLDRGGDLSLATLSHNLKEL